MLVLLYSAAIVLGFSLILPGTIAVPTMLLLAAVPVMPLVSAWSIMDLAARELHSALNRELIVNESTPEDQGSDGYTDPRDASHERIWPSAIRWAASSGQPGLAEILRKLDLASTRLHAAEFATFVGVLSAIILLAMHSWITVS